MVVFTSKLFILFFHSKSYLSASSLDILLWNSLQMVCSSAGREQIERETETVMNNKVRIFHWTHPNKRIVNYRHASLYIPFLKSIITGSIKSIKKRARLKKKVEMKSGRAVAKKAKGIFARVGLRKFRSSVVNCPTVWEKRKMWKKKCAVVNALLHSHFESS